jgi:hypothetical protein
MGLDFEIPESALRTGTFEAFRVDGKPINVKIMGANDATEWARNHASQVDLITLASVMDRQRAEMADGDPEPAVTASEVAIERFAAIRSALKAYDPVLFTEDLLSVKASVLQLEYTFRMLQRVCDPFAVGYSLNLAERGQLNAAASGQTRR